MKKHYLILLALVFILGCNDQGSYHHVSKDFTLIKLSDRAYACVHKIGGKAISNAGIIDNGDATVIFDTFLSPEVAEELPRIVSSLGLSPIRYVVNSHFHNDHIRGNQVFDEDVTILSTRRTADLIAENEPLQIAYEKEKAPERLRHYDSLYNAFKGDTTSREFENIRMWKPYYEVLVRSHEVVRTRLPDTFVEDEYALDGTARKVRLIARGGGHTPSDLILYLPDDKIIFSGDLVFNDCHPYLADGDVDEMIEWLNIMQSMSVDRIVPGHGRIGNYGELEEMKQYLFMLEREAVKHVTSGQDTVENLKVSIPEAYKEWRLELFYPLNLSYFENRIREGKFLTSG